MSLRRITFVTGNAKKLEEFRAIMGTTEKFEVSRMITFCVRRHIVALEASSTGSTAHRDLCITICVVLSD